MVQSKGQLVHAGVGDVDALMRTVEVAQSVLKQPVVLTTQQVDATTTNNSPLILPSSMQPVVSYDFDTGAFDKSVGLHQTAALTPPKSAVEIHAERQRKLGQPNATQPMEDWNPVEIARVMNEQLQHITPEVVAKIIASFGADADLARRVMGMSAGFASAEGLNLLTLAIAQYAPTDTPKLYAPGDITLADNMIYMDSKGTFSPVQRDHHKSQLKSNRFEHTDQVEDNMVVLLDKHMMARLSADNDRLLNEMIAKNCTFIYPRGWEDGLNLFNTAGLKKDQTDAQAIEVRLRVLVERVKSNSGDSHVTQEHIQAALREHAQSQLDKINSKLGPDQMVHEVGPESMAKQTNEMLARQLSGYAGITPRQIEAAIDAYINGNTIQDEAMARRMLQNMLGYNADISSMRKLVKLFDAHIRAHVPDADRGNVHVYLREKQKSFGLLGMMYASLYGISTNRFFDDVDSFVRALPNDQRAFVLLLDDVAASGNSLLKALLGIDNRGRDAEPGLFKRPNSANTQTGSFLPHHINDLVKILPLIGTDDSSKLFVDNGTQKHAQTVYAEAQLLQSLFSQHGVSFFDRLSLAEKVMLDNIFLRTRGYGDTGLNMAFPYMAPNNNTVFFASLLARFFILNRNQSASKVFKGRG